MPYQLAITSAPTGGVLIADLTPFVTSCSVSTNEHGYQELRATIPRSLYDAFRVYDAPGTLHVQLNDGAQPLWVGRLEEPGLRAGTGGALEINAFGYWRALSDVPYTAVWSDTSLARWMPITAAVAAVAFPERYEIRTEDSRLFIAPRKNETYNLNNNEAIIVYQAPSGGARQLVAIQFAYSVNLPAGWQVRAVAANAGFASAAVIWTLATTGALQSGAQHTTFTAKDFVYFDCYYVGGASTTYTGNTGDSFAAISRLRVYASTTNRNTTGISAIGVTPGTATVTPNAMTHIYAGGLVYMSSASGGEIVTVTSVTSTTFTATFTVAHSVADTVVAHNIYASEIVGDVVSVTAAANSTQLQSTTSLITSPNRDIVDAVYEDQYPADIITDLAGQGDSTGALYEAGVDPSRRVYFRQQGSRSQRWYVDVTDLQLNRSLDGLRNSAYTVYEDASGVPVRTAATTNAASVVRYGVTRRQAIPLQTTLAAYATAVRDAEVAASALVQPRASFTVRAVYDSNSARAPLAFVQAGDYLILRNLPPTASNAVDSIRTFRITRTEYDPFSDSLAIEPEAPATTLDALVGGQL